MKDRNGRGRKRPENLENSSGVVLEKRVREGRRSGQEEPRTLFSSKSISGVPVECP